MAPPLMVQQRHGRLVGLAAVDLDRDVIARHPATVQPSDQGAVSSHASYETAGQRAAEKYGMPVGRGGSVRGSWFTRSAGRPFSWPGQVAQQQGLGQAGPLEGGQVQALVAAVRPRAGILYSGDQDPGTRAHGSNESLHL